MIEEPMCLSYSRSSKVEEDGKYHTKRHLSEVANCLCVGRRDTNEILILEPAILTRQRTEEAKQRRKVYGDVGVSFSNSKEYTLRQDDMSNTITTVAKDNLAVEPKSCAIRTRAYAGKPAALEMGGEVANTITSVQKDSMVAEPQISAHPLSHAHEKPTPRADVSPTLRATDYKAPHCVYERQVAYKEMPNGNIRAYDPNTEDKRGISESQITNPNNESPTKTTAQTPKIMEQQTKYRIRKLTPRECYRLMDLEDNDIDKLLTPTDENGKPLIAKSRHYALAGNSICVGVLYHIFRRLFIDTESTEPVQLTLF